MENLIFKNILMITDIEGSSGCWNYKAASFKTDEWAIACLEMTKDIDVVVKALFKAGVEKILVKDFHRTGYNILREKLDKKAILISGYHIGKSPGIGNLRNIEAIMFIGLHAASGTNGFLPHTLTSRITKILVNEKPLTEVEIISASLSLQGIKPIFFSGCQEATRQAKMAIPGIETFFIDKTKDRENFDVIK